MAMPDERLSRVGLQFARVGALMGDNDCILRRGESDIPYVEAM